MLWLLCAAGAQAQDSTGVVIAPASQDATAAPQMRHGAGSVPGASPARLTIQRAGLPTETHRTIESLNVRDADLRDVFRAIAAQYNLNLIVDNRIEQRVTIRLSNLSVIDALLFLCEEYGISLEQRGAVLRIRKPEEVPPPPRPVQVLIRDSLLTADLSGDDVQAVVRAIAEKSRVNIVVRQGVSGSLSGFLQDVPLETGLRTLLASNGFSLHEKGGIYYVDRAGLLAQEADPQASSYWVHVQEGGIELDVVGAGILDVLRDLSSQVGLDLVTYGSVEGHITAKWSGLSLEQTLNYLFKGTNLTYRREGNVFIVGDKGLSGIASTKLIRLRHIRSEGLVERLPDYLRQNAAFQVIKEQNGIVVIGTNDLIAETEAFIGQIDIPTPQILIEALVVDFEETDLVQLGVTFGRDGRQGPSGGYVFGAGEDQRGGYVWEGNAERASNILSFWSELVGLGSIGRLPSDFYLRLQALVHEGKAEVRSRPQIATLNGHTASISVGTTQYYILKSIVPYPVPGQPGGGEVEHFERVEANVSLEITPWVSASGDVTAEIRPEFATPVGVLDPRIPPTINNRVVNTTVRLRDGETVIIGGLIQETQSAAYNKIPILGSIPLLGHLFRNRRHDNRKSELVIFITPHVFYGDDQDETKWNRLKQEMDLSRIQISAPKN